MPKSCKLLTVEERDILAVLKSQGNFAARALRKEAKMPRRDSVPDPQLWPNRLNDGLANATHQFPCNQQPANACVEYDG
jgi:hypothetical protein